MIPSLPPGAHFEGFRVIEQVGRGSMGTVYKVEEEETGAVRALKVRSLLTERARDMRRFEREAEAGQEIDSPYIAKTLKTGSEPASGIAWILMEYAAGVTLTELVEQRGALSRELVVTLAQQMFHAVGAAHAIGIVHRDLSTNNIRVTFDDAGTPHTRVLDFGIAKSTRSRTAAWTKPGLGTPLWVAPEQHLSGYTPAPSGDVWALGLLLFYLLTGKLYWKYAQPGATSLGELSMEILRHPVPGATERASELGVSELLPEHFDAWFGHVVVRDQGERYADAGEAGAALWQVFEGVAPVAVKPRPKSVSPLVSSNELSHAAGAPLAEVATIAAPTASQAPPSKKNVDGASAGDESPNAESAHAAVPRSSSTDVDARSSVASRPSVLMPSGRVLLLLFATLLLAGYGLYLALDAARL